MSNQALDRLESLLAEGRISTDDFLLITRELRASAPVASPDQSHSHFHIAKQFLFNLVAQFGFLLALPLFLGLLLGNMNLTPATLTLMALYCAIVVAAAQILATLLAPLAVWLLWRAWRIAPSRTYFATTWVMLFMLLPALIFSE
jgi:hypothetical protein